MTMPKVSCIMPTSYYRRAFVGRAILMFLNQTYQNTELIIVDEYGQVEGGVNSIVKGYEEKHIRYLTVESDRKLSIGAKRNLAASVATGDILCHWDDDDYYGPHRLALQACPIIEGEADCTALKMVHLLDMSTMRLWRCSDDLHKRLFWHDCRAGTLMYKAHYWHDGITYPNSSQGEDVRFLHNLLSEFARLDRLVDETAYICVRHQNNVTPPMEYGPPGWEEAELRRSMSQEEIIFYYNLRGAMHHDTSFV